MTAYTYFFQILKKLLILIFFRAPNQKARGKFLGGDYTEWHLTGFNYKKN